MASGSYSKSQLEALWVQAGGNKAVAKIAAAIALAESGGSPTARNPEGPEHAEGLWQIKGQVVGGNILDPQVNAANAVAKYRAAGGFSPWTTYTSGAYKSHLGGSSLLGTIGKVLNPTNLEPFKGTELESGVLGKGGILGGGGITGVEGFIKAITEPQTWLRVAEGVGGTVLFMVGLKTLTRGSGGGAVSEGGRQIQSVRGIGAKVGRVAVGVAK
jgi:hypothetical protein